MPESPLPIHAALRDPERPDERLAEPIQPECGADRDPGSHNGILSGPSVQYVTCQDCLAARPDVAEAVRRFRAVLMIERDAAHLCPGCTSEGPHIIRVAEGEPVECPGTGPSLPGTHVCECCKDAQPYRRVVVGIDPASDGSAAVAILRNGTLTIRGPLNIGGQALRVPEVTSDDLDAWAARRPQPNPEPDWKPGDVAEVLCSDGQWRSATYGLDMFQTPCWRFPDGLMRLAVQSVARPAGWAPQVPEADANDALRAADKVLREAKAHLDTAEEVADGYAGGWSLLWAALTDVHNELAARASAAAAGPGKENIGRWAAYTDAAQRVRRILTENVPPWDKDAVDLLPEVEPEDDADRGYIAAADGTGEGWTPPGDDPAGDPPPNWAADVLETRKRRAQIIAGPERKAPANTVNVFVQHTSDRPDRDALAEALYAARRVRVLR